MSRRRRGEGSPPKDVQLPDTKSAEANIDALRLELAREMPGIDLHGLYPEEAESRVDIFLVDSYADADMVKIVYGVGEGKMKKIVLRYLRNHPMVKTVAEKQGGCVVLFDK